MLQMTTEQIVAADGEVFAGYMALPEQLPAPGILLLQEIFGVGEYLRAVGDRLAALGYVVMMPDVFWRQEPGLNLGHDEAGLQAAPGYAARYFQQISTGLDDLDAAYRHLEGMEATTGPTGLMGFCFGGRLAWHLAARQRPAATVAYYPTKIAEALQEAPRISEPMLIHVGSEDPHVPAEAVEALGGAIASKANIELQVYQGAGHAFDNHTVPMFSNPTAAAAAWAQTVDFLGRHLPI